VVEANSLPTPWQVEFRAGSHRGRADTVKNGVGGTDGLRPHELLDAAFASCLTISAGMALADLGCPDSDVTVHLMLDRGESTTRFRYRVDLGPEAEPYRQAVMDRLLCSPVRATLSRELTFEPV
jgi:putative redox protein